MGGAAKIVTLVLVLALLGGFTALAANASRAGWGAQEPEDEHVSVRQESVGGGGFFSSWSGRSHFGGGLGGGK